MAGLRLGALLERHWLQLPRTPLSWLLAPLAGLYGLLVRLDRWRTAARPRPAGIPPIVVVGNLVAGGAGKTPTVIALVHVLRAAGRTPGVISRGYGRRSTGTQPVGAQSTAADVGDEPLLIRRRTDAPTWVAQRRLDAALALCAAHPEVDLLVCDDGLQHRGLPRDVEVIVFDERGVGNGALLPAGPLREPIGEAPPKSALVLYNHATATTCWPGFVAQRRLGGAVPLGEWLAGKRGTAQPLSVLTGRSLLAMAGIAVPQRFFSMLAAAGIDFTPLALPDHHPYTTAPWPADTAELVTTEKDAVKLGQLPPPLPRIWVVPLDLQLPQDFIAALLARLANASAPASARPQR